jgi:5'-phosphate synthase pdxT subunit
MKPLRSFGKKRAIWGTCAGAIFLARDTNSQQPLLGLMDISVERNAFGRQVDSFEIELPVPDLENPEQPFRAIFIRAPFIERVGKGVQVLARLPDENNGGGRIVAARQGHFLATSFHPELTGDNRFHQFFLKLTKG